MPHMGMGWWSNENWNRYSFKKLLKQDSDYINLSSKQTSTSLWLRPLLVAERVSQSEGTAEISIVINQSHLVPNNSNILLL